MCDPLPRYCDKCDRALGQDEESLEGACTLCREVIAEFRKGMERAIDQHIQNEIRGTGPDPVGLLASSRSAKPGTESKSESV